MTDDSDEPTIRYDFGTFDGGYWPTDYCSLDEPVPASEVMLWSEFDRGEAEFWPSGDRPEMTLLFDDEDNKITCKRQLESLQDLLDHLGGDSVENFLRIRHAMRRLQVGICSLPPHALKALPLHIFIGATLAEVENRAVAELAVRYRDIPWQGPASEPCAFLDQYRNHPAWGLETVAFGDKVALLVWPTARRFSHPIHSRR